jgi:hypothetical protein
LSKKGLGTPSMYFNKIKKGKLSSIFKKKGLGTVLGPGFPRGPPQRTPRRIPPRIPLRIPRRIPPEDPREGRGNQSELFNVSK